MGDALSSPAIPNSDIKRVAILFSGGPAPAANAVISSAATCFSRSGIEVLGIHFGYSQLMKYGGEIDTLEEGRDYIVLRHGDLEGTRTSRGIEIGTARDNPGKKIHSRQDLKDPQKTAPMQTAYDALCSLGVDALVSIGGDDTLTTANKFKLFQDELREQGKLKRLIRVVHVPKTIDNDYHGIDFTFGYFTAVDMMARELRNLLSDSMATGAYFAAQVMGRKAGWLAYGAAIAGEASLVISLEDFPDAEMVLVEGKIPEGSEFWSLEATVDPKTGKPRMDEGTGEPQHREVFNVAYLVNRVVDMILAREKAGTPYGVIVVAEGMSEYLPLAELKECMTENEFRSLKPDEHGHYPVSQVPFGRRLAKLVTEEYRRRDGTLRGDKFKVNGLQFGYEVRCDRPNAFDVILGSQLGVGAYRALVEKGYNGVMVSFQGQLSLIYEPFETLVNENLRAAVRLVKPDEDFHQLARYLQARLD